MIEMGIIVGIALLTTLVKMSWKWKMRTLSSPLLVDVIVFILLLCLHWGTFSGVMVATIGAMTCSVVLSAARKCIGHADKGVYIPGMWNMSHKL